MIQFQSSQELVRVWVLMFGKRMLEVRKYHLLILCLLSACAHPPGAQTYRDLDNLRFLPQANLQLEIPGLSRCTHANDSRLNLNSDKPTVVIVHGCFSSAGRFRSLADVFAFHGQQTVCFNYNDRQSLDKSANKLAAALRRLSHNMPGSKISVLGHSQGGLVARRGLTEVFEDPISHIRSDIELTTISSPFGGIKVSAHCGSNVLAWVSLGIIKPICYLITGGKYREIPPSSDFMRNPGRLLPQVKRHLKIVTDEANTCRRYNQGGDCIEDDYVFSIDEQKQRIVDREHRMQSILVRAGHVEIVGDEETAPQKLIALLQQTGILNNTPPQLKNDLAKLLDELY